MRIYKRIVLVAIIAGFLSVSLGGNNGVMRAYADGGSGPRCHNC